MPPISIEFRRAVAVLAVAELMEAGQREDVALAFVADSAAGAAFAGADTSARAEALREYRIDLTRQPPVEQPSRPLEIARYHYDHTQARLRKLGGGHAKSAAIPLAALEPSPAE